MQHLESDEISYQVDIVFAGDSIPNLLLAKTLLERFEGIRVKVNSIPLPLRPTPSERHQVLRYSTSRLQSEDYMMGISANAVHGLRDISPDLTADFLNCEQCSTDEAHTSFVTLQQFRHVVEAGFTTNCFLSDTVINSVHQTADLVEIDLQNGQKCFTKLLIQDASLDEESAPTSHFIESSFTISGTSSSNLETHWEKDRMYITRHLLYSGIEACSIISLGHVSSYDILCCLDSPHLLKNSDGFHIQNNCCRQLRKISIAPALGRFAKSGELSQFVPQVSELKLEQEIEDALFLRKAIALKGLTAAALTDWKRRKSQSRITQYLMSASSPLDVMFQSGMTLLYSCKTTSTTKNINRDLGKPLVYSPKTSP